MPSPTQVALGEAALDARLKSVQDKVLSSVAVEVSSQRTFGAFIMTNIDEVVAELAAIETQVGK